MKNKFTIAYFSNRNQLLRIVMRTLLLLFCTTVFALTPGRILSQNSKITIKEDKTMSVDEVFDLIMEQTDYKFFYEEGIFKNFPLVKVKKGIFNANKLLNESLKDAPIDVTIGKNNTVIIKEKSTILIQQSIKIKGKVVDKSGQPLPGANVIEKATKKGTQTDFEGNFTLEISNKNAKLEVSFIGFITQEYLVNSQIEVKVILQENAAALEEVVVVGYGTTKKANLTGGVAQITAKQIENFIAPNLGQMLQGVSPGLNVTLGSGDINGEANINIRGINSINGGGPLILIDGVEGNMNKISPTDVESISVLKDASSAAVYGARAAYGVILINTKKGKDGKLTVSYNTNLSWSSPTIRTDNFITNGLKWARLSDKLSLLENSSTYLGLTPDDYEYLEARELDPSLPSVLIKNVNGAERYIHYGNTDWWNTLFSNNQASQEHNFSLSGGTDKLSMYLSGRFYSRDGIYKIKKDVLDTKTLRIRVNAKPTSWFEVGNSTNVFTKDYTHPATNTRFLSGADNSEDWRKYTFHAAPLFLPRNPDGSIIIKGAYTGTRDIADGTFADLINGKSKGQENDFEVLNTTNATIHISKKLKIKTDYSFRPRYQSEWVRIISTPYTNQPNGEGVSLFKEDTQIYKELERKSLYQAFNAYADYVYNPIKNHTLTALVGFNQEWNSFKRNIASRNGNLSEELNSFNLASGENIFLGSTENEWAIRGVFYRIKYDIDEKYLLEINGRHDLTSRFPTENRYGVFPSGSVGWKISSEKFWESIKPYVGTFKLRASFGALGNEKSVSEYGYLSTMGLSQSTYIADGGLTNYYTTPLPSVRSNYTWESTETLNLGVDISAFKNRFNLTYDKYRRNTFNMLVPGKVLPSVFGAPSPVENAANLQTKGFELSLDWKDNFKIAGKPFNYNLGFVLSDSRSYITKFDNPTGSLLDYYVGKEIGEVWGYTVEGFFESDNEYLSHANQQLVSDRIYNNYLINHPLAGDIKFADLDGDNKVGPGDRTLSNPGDLKRIGNTNARYNYGITMGAEFAGFDLNVFAQGIMHRDWNPGTDNGMFWGPFSRQYNNFYPESIESISWTPDNPNAYFPRLAVYSERINIPGDRARFSQNRFEGSQLGVNSDKYLQNAAYLRIKNITIGYSIAKNWVNKLKLEKVRLYATGMNLFTFSPLYKNNPDRTIDPEQLGDGNDYPFNKTIAFGLDIKF